MKADVEKGNIWSFELEAEYMISLMRAIQAGVDREDANDHFTKKDIENVTAFMSAVEKANARLIIENTDYSDFEVWKND